MFFLSIVIPAFNAASSIEKCLKSIALAMNNCDEKIEAIIIDDGSTDNTPKLVDAFCEQNEHFRCIHRKNEGVSVARNVGIDASLGKWISFVDSDDYVSSDIFNVLLPYLKEDSVDSVMFSFFRNNKNLSSKISFGDFIIEDILNMSTNELTTEMFLCTVWNKAYKKSIIKSNNISFPPGIKFGEDFIFNSQYHTFSKNIKIIDTSLYFYDDFNSESAVNKFYVDYDKYINAIHKAYFEMLANLKISSKTATNAMLNFVSKRWLYAVEAAFSYRNRSTYYIKMLYQHIPEEIHKYIIENTSSPFYILSKLKMQNHSLSLQIFLIRIKLWFKKTTIKIYQFLK